MPRELILLPATQKTRAIFLNVGHMTMMRHRRKILVFVVRKLNTKGKPRSNGSLKQLSMGYFLKIYGNVCENTNKNFIM